MVDLDYIESAGNQLDEFLGRAYADGEPTMGIFAVQDGPAENGDVTVIAVERGWGSLTGINLFGGQMAHNIGVLIAYDYMDAETGADSWSAPRLDEMLREAGVVVGGYVDFQCYGCI